MFSNSFLLVASELRGDFAFGQQVGPGAGDTASPRAWRRVALFFDLVVTFKIFESVYSTGPSHWTDSGARVGERP